MQNKTCQNIKVSEPFSVPDGPDSMDGGAWVAVWWETISDGCRIYRRPSDIDKNNLVAI